MVHTTALRKPEILCFQQILSERSHHRRVITAENARQIEEIRGEHRIQVDARGEKTSGRWKNNIQMDFKDTGHVHVDLTDGLFWT
jgi:hypothetical protein